MGKKNQKNSAQNANTQEDGAQEAQRLQREATKSRAGGPFGPVAADDDETQPGTEDVPV